MSTPVSAKRIMMTTAITLFFMMIVLVLISTCSISFVGSF